MSSVEDLPVSAVYEPQLKEFGRGFFKFVNEELQKLDQQLVFLLVMVYQKDVGGGKSKPYPYGNGQFVV